MTQPSTTHTGQHEDYRHYRECAPDLCHIGVADVVHREVPQQITPQGDGDPTAPTLTWALEQHDEIRDGVQEARRPIACLTIGGERVEVTLQELLSIAGELRALYWRGLGREMRVVGQRAAS